MKHTSLKADKMSKFCSFWLIKITTIVVGVGTIVVYATIVVGIATFVVD